MRVQHVQAGGGGGAPEARRAVQRGGGEHAAPPAQRRDGGAVPQQGSASGHAARALRALHAPQPHAAVVPACGRVSCAYYGTQSPQVVSTVFP